MLKITGNILKNLLFPVINKIDPQKDWIFIKDSVMFHTSDLVQDFLKETILWHYIKNDQWPPKPPDSNPLDHYFCKKVKMKVYENRVNTPFLIRRRDDFKNKVSLEEKRLKTGRYLKTSERISWQTQCSQRIQWVVHQNAFWKTFFYIF